jgi:membrane associated rhomboid family serine protease
MKKVAIALGLVVVLGVLLTLAGPEIAMAFGSAHIFGIVVLAGIVVWTVLPKKAVRKGRKARKQVRRLRTI